MSVIVKENEGSLCSSLEFYSLTIRIDILAYSTSVLFVVVVVVLDKSS